MSNIGKIGENLAIKFLKQKGFEIIEKNWWLKKYGEIDIIAKKNKTFYFIEVKTLKTNKYFAPENHYTKKKQIKFHNLVNYYSNKNKINNFETLLITINLGKKTRIKVYKNV